MGAGPVRPGMGAAAGSGVPRGPGSRRTARTIPAARAVWHIAHSGGAEQARSQLRCGRLRKSMAARARQATPRTAGPLCVATRRTTGGAVRWPLHPRHHCFPGGSVETRQRRAGRHQPAGVREAGLTARAKSARTARSSTSSSPKSSSTVVSSAATCPWTAGCAAPAGRQVRPGRHLRRSAEPRWVEPVPGPRPRGVAAHPSWSR